MHMHSSVNPWCIPVVPIDDMDEDMGELGDGDALEEMEERDDSSCTFTKHNGNFKILGLSILLIVGR